MKLRLALPTLESLDELGPEPQGCLVVTTFAEDRPLRGLTGLVDWRLNGQLSRLLRRDFVDGHWLETTMAPIEGRLPFDRLLLVGLGRRGDFAAQRFEEACHTCFAALAGVGALRWAMPLPGRGGLDIGVRQALAGWKRALQTGFSAEQLAAAELTILENSEVLRELAEPMKAVVRELS